jgi:thioredoxin-related protein
MKNIILTLFILFGIVTLQAQEIKWMTLDEAIALQKKKPKPIFMDVYTDWCGPCKMLDSNTFHDKNIVEIISKNYYAVKFNAEGNIPLSYLGTVYSNPGYVADRKGRNSAHDFTRFLQVQGYPSMYIFDRNGVLKSPIVGYRTPEQLIEELK